MREVFVFLFLFQFVFLISSTFVLVFRVGEWRLDRPEKNCLHIVFTHDIKWPFDHCSLLNR